MISCEGFKKTIREIEALFDKAYDIEEEGKDADSILKEAWKAFNTLSNEFGEKGFELSERDVFEYSDEELEDVYNDLTT